MKPFRTTALAVLVCLVGSACQPDDAGPEPQAPALSIQHPQPGQRALFERFSLAAGQVYPRLYPDTLILEVMQVQGSKIHVSEYLSRGSVSLSSEGIEVPFPEEHWQYTLSPSDQGASSVAGLSIEALAGERRLDSRLFPSLDQEGQLLRHPAHGESASLEGLRIQTDYLPVDRDLRLEDEEAGKAVSLRHSGRSEGLPGFTFVHHADRGLLWMMVEQDLPGNVSGWRLIESH